MTSMERLFYTQFIPGEGFGYIATMCEREPGYASTSLICNFGTRLADAERFCDDCRKGVITEKQIESMTKENYSNKPMIYLGNGKLREQ